MSKIIFTAPDNYTSFKCKMGNCRRSCCLGWHVTVSMEEYYRLIGLECSPELRRKLDGSVFMLENPTKVRFAEFARNYLGDCPMHGDDGLCMLQCANGEDVLPSVCRYYPRSPRTLHATECALSVSCEGVCELLMAKKEKLTFVDTPLEFCYHLPQTVGGFVTEVYRDVRRDVIEILQNRKLSFGSRLLTLIGEAEALNEPLKAQNREKTREILEENKISEDGSTAETAKASAEALDETRYLLRKLTERYPIDEYANGREEFSAEDYAHMRDRLYENYPALDTMLEQIMVNHVFYMGFPFGEERLDFATACAALVSLFAVWKYALVVKLSEDGNEDHFADLTSEFFRMAENSNYDLCAAALLNESGFLDGEKLRLMCAM